ncbi:ribosomal protein large subunit L9 [Thermoplasma volcanium GSS1]|uniref:Large ribosomal subunit protein uL6 n=1 Tax=Thermoplasma volcanium (strain ATCC 51530 / DSM 4299 / JCM 9571 / NBRC 15438 / GSS1) TaxID=273116 RepID=RL6_THEVO|nr:50S ribosomal protein L6 [Thermoplasma volcanium]Q97BW0.1 RecName: Full=Large ribosomal subunit protein uL6; AltName: Full=50S ribosomal protein L6 [Thermoplasma volcanium GSS1]BAB59487.1 ribosomal protein large subunit L9 [Thermoplasma volcanium GSS1]
MIKWEEASVIEIPKDVKVGLSGTMLSMTFGNKKLEKKFADNYVRLLVEDNKIKIVKSKNNSRERGIVGTWASEISNMVKGLKEGFQYEMKIDYSHFPMRVSVKGKTVVIENFFGERSPRTAEIVGETQVSVKGDRLFLNGPSKKDVGETAANIERATIIKGFDPRVFQDGIYLISKGE